jgi:hypothetical protein
MVIVLKKFKKTFGGGGKLTNVIDNNGFFPSLKVPQLPSSLFISVGDNNGRLFFILL